LNLRRCLPAPSRSLEQPEIGGTLERFVRCSRGWARDYSGFGVGRFRMSSPRRGPRYRNCLMCGAPFRMWQFTVEPNRGKFCTVECYKAARRLLTEALADGRLDFILAPEREAARRARAARKMDAYTECRLVADGRTHRHDIAMGKEPT
jgi:hypothetical protein